MSILIKGMEMPTSCYACDFAYQDQDSEHNVCWTCAADHKAAGMYERRGDCPLIELPPHGRLIDADALFREISNRTNAAYEWRQKATDEDIQARADATYMAFVEVALTISNLPTIVEAESD